MTSLIKLNQSHNQQQAWAKALILVGLGIYFFVLIFSGKLSNYINIRFAWLSYLAAFLFIGLGLWSVRYLVKKQAHLTQHGASHMPITWSGIFMLALPLIFATFLPSQPLGADAISGSVSLQPIGGVSSEARFNVPPLERNVLDWLREFDAVSNPAKLDGLPVDIIAFVYREPEMTATQFMAARFTLSCCVADAFAVGMPVDYAEAETIEDGAWVRIQGTLQAGEFRGGQVPIIIPDTIEPTETPSNPYLYS